MNSFNLTLSGKHFICPSILNESFAGYSNLGWRSLPFMTLNTSFQPLPACKVYMHKNVCMCDTENQSPKSPLNNYYKEESKNNKIMIFNNKL